MSRSVSFVRRPACKSMHLVSQIGAPQQLGVHTDLRQRPEIPKALTGI